MPKKKREDTVVTPNKIYKTVTETRNGPNGTVSIQVVSPDEENKKKYRLKQRKYLVDRDTWEM